MKRGAQLAAFLLVVASAASSQQLVGPATFSPAAPTSADEIRATYTFVSAGCGTAFSTTRSGSFIRTTVFVSGCVIGPPPFPNSLSTVFGPVPPGTYTYELYEVYESGTPQLISSQPLVVDAAAVPTLDTGLLLALVLTLALLGIFAARR